MRLVYQCIYAPLRDRTFHSLEELNAAIRPLLEEHNRHRFQRLPYSRWELFEQIERHALAPLPPYHFPLQQIREVTVGFNYHVELREDRHHYSVHWQLRTRDPRTKVKLLYDERTVSIYYDNVRIAEYRRDRHPDAAAAPVVCRVDPGTIPALGADARRQRRGGDRAGAEGRQVPAAGIPFLPRHPEPGEELRRRAAGSRLRAGAVLRSVLLPPHSGFGGPCRAVCCDLPQSHRPCRQQRELSTVDAVPSATVCPEASTQDTLTATSVPLPTPGQRAARLIQKATPLYSLAQDRTTPRWHFISGMGGFFHRNTHSTT